MPYVHRNSSNDIDGLFAVLQPEFAEEFLPDNDLEVIAFRAPPPKSEAPLTTEELATHLVTRNIITRAEVDAIKVAR